MLTETVALHTADGVVLDAEIAVPSSAWAAAAICHPHPLYGGDMHNNVVEALYRALHDAGAAVLRFDFRGVGRSGGEHDDGQSERLDAAAALELVAPLAADGPVLLCGYSFGALVALDVAVPELTGWVAVAAPFRSVEPVAAHDHRPKLMIVGTHDQMLAAEAARLRAEDWDATTLAEVEMADHFFAGRTAAVADLAVAFLRSLR